MNAFVATGPYGVLVVSSTAALIIAALVAAAVRGPRVVAIALVALGFLPAVLGVTALITGVIDTQRTIETMSAPTPGDLSGGVSASVLCLLVGMAGSVLVLAAAAFAFTRSRREDGLPADVPPR